MKLSRSVRSIFRRKKKVCREPRCEAFLDPVEKTEVLEETESDFTLNDSSSCSLDCAAPKEEVRVKPKPKPKKVVSFSEVTVRHYDRILGDNPHCRFPLSLDWRWNEEEKLKVDQFEDQRAEREARTAKDRIQPRLYVPPASSAAAAEHYLRHVHMEQDYDDQLYGELTLYERRARLRAFGYTEASLRVAERRRIVALALQWRDGGTPRFPFSDKFVSRYTK